VFEVEKSPDLSVLADQQRISQLNDQTKEVKRKKTIEKWNKMNDSSYKWRLKETKEQRVRGLEG
jgi:hypothetical protein